MTTEIPTKSPAPLPDNSAENTAADRILADHAFDRFHPDMPRIPGVAGATQVSPAKSDAAIQQRLMRILGAAAVAVALLGALAWWTKGKPRKAEDSVAIEAAKPELPAPSLPPVAPTPPAHAGPVVAASVAELSKPWSAKKFIFAKPFTHEDIDAMVIRLPGGDLWAFALQEPYGRCELEFVTDLHQLSAKYGYHASHPMVVNPCNNTVYDPLKVGPLGGSTWARGEIVQGGGMRPPLSIDVVVNGRSIIADRME
jgi:hypothetical protein